MKAVKSFVIDRKKWLRGSRGASLLRHPRTGKMCCLGFFALECGIPLEQIRDKPSPDGCHFDAASKFPAFLFENSTRHHNSHYCYELMHVNDDKKLEPHQREKRLTELFKKKSIRVTFK